MRYWHGVGIGIGIENTTSSGIGIGIGIESFTFQVLELVLVLKKMTSGIAISIDLLLSWQTAIRWLTCERCIMPIYFLFHFILLSYCTY